MHNLVEPQDQQLLVTCSMEMLEHVSDWKLGEALGTRRTYQAAVTKVGERVVLHSHLDGLTGVQGTLVLSPSYLPVEGLHICSRLKANNTFRDQQLDLREFGLQREIPVRGEEGER